MAEERGPDLNHSGENSNGPNFELEFVDKRHIFSVPPITEVKALIAYASRRGIDASSDLLENLSQALNNYTSAGDIDKPAMGKALLIAYSDVCAVTYPKYGVNGRTVLDTGQAVSNSKWVISVGIIFGTLAFGTEILDLYFNSIPEQSDGFLGALSLFHGTILAFLSPFFWGGLGAAVYLAKRVYDEIQSSSFDKDLLKGSLLRIWLGAILGAIIQYFYDDQNISSAEMKLDANLVAFFAGVSVKVAYGSIEKSVEALAEAINIKKRKKPGAPSERKNDNPGPNL